MKTKIKPNINNQTNKLPIGVRPDKLICPSTERKNSGIQFLSVLLFSGRKKKKR